jgi:hypothetical protein
MIGARVITTAGSAWKLEKAKELGADTGSTRFGIAQ